MDAISITNRMARVSIDTRCQYTVFFLDTITMIHRFSHPVIDVQKMFAMYDLKELFWLFIMTEEVFFHFFWNNLLIELNLFNLTIQHLVANRCTRTADFVIWRKKQGFLHCFNNFGCSNVKKNVDFLAKKLVSFHEIKILILSVVTSCSTLLLLNYFPL